MRTLRQFGTTLQVDTPGYHDLGKNTQLLILPKLGWDNHRMTVSERTKAVGPIAHLPLVSLPAIIVGIGYLAVYVLLDWISFIEPYGSVGITTWNPSTGLSLALGLILGRCMIPFLFLGPLLSDLILNQSPVPWSVELSFVALIGGGYSTALLFLLRPSLRFDPALSSMRDLVLLMIVALFSTVFVASGYVAATIFAGLLPPNEFAAAAFRYWVGDMIGIMVVTPFVLIVLTHTRLLRMSFETVLQFTAIIGALAIMFGYAEERRFQLFYVLFLPIVWMAVRTGAEGVTLGLLITQLGVITGVAIFPLFGHDVLAFQVLMLILTTTGLTAGELVTEHRRTEFQLRLHRDSLSRVAQLGGMGELTVAIAHELNQPLMAARTYTRLIEDAVSSGDQDRAMVAETAKKAVAQVERAAEVVRSLRALIRLDSSNRCVCSVERIANETLALCQPALDRIHVGARANIASDLHPVKVDILQIEQVLLNLLHNSIEAFVEAETVNPAILIEASAAGAGFVEIRVKDNGPGFPSDLLSDSFLPFLSTKAEGLGIGLSLCKSIVEAHGGRLWLDRDALGGAVYFTIPAVETSRDG
jgi:two-component system, LuxR family, sensor kinase FixL